MSFLFGIEFRTIGFQIFFDLLKVHINKLQIYIVLDGYKSFDSVKIFFFWWFFSFSPHILKFLLVNEFPMLDNLYEYKLSCSREFCKHVQCV